MISFSLTFFYHYYNKDTNCYWVSILWQGLLCSLTYSGQNLGSVLKELTSLVREILAQYFTFWDGVKDRGTKEVLKFISVKGS